MKTAVNGHPIAGAIAAALMTLRPELLAAVTDEDLLNPEYADGLRECLRELIQARLDLWQLKQEFMAIRMETRPVAQWLTWIGQRMDSVGTIVEGVLNPKGEDEVPRELRDMAEEREYDEVVRLGTMTQEEEDNAQA